MEKFAGFVAKQKFLVLIIATVLLLLAAFGMVKTKVDYNLKTYVPSLDSVNGIKVLDEDMGLAATGILEIKDMKYSDVVILKDKISKINGVEKAIWVDEVLNTGIPKEILPEEINKIFSSENSKLIVIMFTDPAFSTKTSNALGEIKKVTNKQCMLSGVSAIAKDTMDLGMKDGKTVGIVASIILLLVFALTTGSIFVPIVMLLTSIFAIVFNMGTNAIVGGASIATIPLVAIMQIGVTFNFAIFLYFRYLEGKEILGTKEDAMTYAVAKMTKVIAGCSLVTIVIALSLIAMNIGLTTDVAVVFTKGIVFSLLATVTVLPVLLLIFDKAITVVGHKPLLPSFNASGSFVASKYKVLMVVFVVLFVAAFIGKQNTNVSYDMLKTLPQDMDSVVVLNKLKKDLNMPISHFVIANKSVGSNNLAEMTKKLSELDGINLALGDDMLMGGAIPDGFLPEDITKLYSTDTQKIILLNSDYTPGTAELNAQIEAMTKIVKSYDKNAMITGEGVIGKDVADIAEPGLINVKFIAIIGLLIVFALIFGSITIPFILVFLLELGIFMNIGILFYTGQTIPFMVSSILGLVQLGVTVGYAVLITSRFKEELGNGSNKTDAIKTAVMATSKSVVVSSLPVLLAAIGAAIATKLSVVTTVSLLVANGALVSMIVLIYLLPAVLVGSEGLISKTSLFWTKKTKNDTNITEVRF